MNNISEQLLRAVDIVVDQKIEQLEFDKTIEATIENLVDLDSGEYKVKYKGNIFSAFSNDLTKTYRVNDSVYITVPDGNFSKKKLITSLVSAQSLSYTQLMALQNAIFEISPPFEDLYGGNLYDAKASYGVVAGAPSSSALSYKHIYKGPDIYSASDYHGLFQQYSNKYELIRIQASFLTQLQSSHVKGNYGLEVEFYAKDKDNGTTAVSYALDLNQFNGDPYRFSVYSQQSVIIKVQKNYLLGLKSISLFEKDFEYDRIIENGLVTTKENRTDANIFVKDISIQFVDRKDLSDTNYYLMIAAPRGIALSSPNITTLDLVGRLVYKGEDIMDTKTCKCQWFRRDLSVVIGAEDYNKDAGFGWRPLDTKDYKLSITSSTLKHQDRYKLLVTYNSKVALNAEIEVFNRNSGYDYSIKQNTNGDDISLQLINNTNNSLLYGDWYMSYPDRSYIEIPNGKKENSVSISPYLKYSAVTFYCAVYNYARTEVIGTIEHIIVNSESSEDVIIQYVGEDTFRYDANGDVAFEDTEKERTLQMQLTWKDNVGTAYTVDWAMRNQDGTEKVLTNTEYKPVSSMIDKIWIDNYNVLHYNVKQKYKIDFQNNTLIVKIKTITGEEYLFEKEILFLKDGDQGTNGTTYVVAIRPCDASENKLSGFNPLYYANGRWNGTGLKLKSYVYKDGELINNNSSYNIKYKWEGINVNLSNSGEDYLKVAQGTGSININNSATCQFYVKIQVTIVDNVNDRQTEIYASYPVDVLYGDVYNSGIDISSIPSYIKYTASGLTPSFYSNNITCAYMGNNVPAGNIISLNTNILEIEERPIGSGLIYLKPASNFIYENIQENRESNIAVISCAVSGGHIIHPIIMYLDTYGNEAINGWDGTALEIDKDNSKYIFAPQVGAGEKDSYNRFTGVVMGKDSAAFDEKGKAMIGLYGYQAGVNVFGLMSNGKAYFGAKAGGGQIVLDGRYATLFGGNVVLNERTGSITPAANGMYIRLADRNPGTTKAIGIGYATHTDENGKTITEENFFVRYDGTLKATGADIQGILYAVEGRIGGTARQGGWVIKLNRIYSGNNSTHVELNSDPNSKFAIWAGKTNAGTSYTPSSGTGDNKVYGSIASPAPFVVTRDGFVYAENIRVKGHIDAKSGTIANWVIQKNYLQDVNKKVGMASSGNAAFWAGSGLSVSSDSISDQELDSKFLVTRSGKLYCASAQVSGKITAKEGKIGNWLIRNNRLENDDGTVILSTSGLTLGNFYAGAAGNIYIKDGNERPFQVSSTGRLTATSANIGGTISADAGRIGSWNINNGAISCGKTILRSNGQIYCEDVDISGKITATELTCNKGTIGGWNIDQTKLTGGRTTLNSSSGITTNVVKIGSYGKVGAIDSSDGDGSPTSGIGLVVSNNEVVVTDRGARLTAGGKEIVLTGQNLTFRNIPAENQFGIYARFA